jgi:beta-glucosidase
VSLNSLKLVFVILLLIPAGAIRAQQSGIPPYKRAELPIEERVADLLSRMTIEEKFWQLFMTGGDLSEGKEKYAHGIFGLGFRDHRMVTSASEQMLDYRDRGVARSTAEKVNRIQKFFVEETRLGIPIIAFDEALHGLLRDGATAFPQSIALAATWDVPMMGKVSRAIAEETRGRGLRDVLSPVVNVARDVRWGRVEETYGEDPYLSAAMGVAFVRSFEEMGVITTPKHFVANSGDGGRDSYPIEVSERMLDEVYFPPFKACFQEGGSMSVMSSYNSLDGVPSSANAWLLRKVLKERWGFKGFVISDAGAVGGILDLHHTVRDREESAKSAIEGGLDVIFQTDYDHHRPLLKAFTEGMVDSAAINEAVSRVLRAKFALGLFEHPYTDPAEAERSNGSAAHRDVALQSAREAIVLLKNEGRALPLPKSLRSIAVIGDDAVEARLGGYSGPGIGKISILDGIRKSAGAATRVEFARGCGRRNPAVAAVPPDWLYGPDGKPGLAGEYFPNITLSGTPTVARRDQNIDFGWTLFGPDASLRYDWYSARWTGTLKAPVSGRVNIGVQGDDGYRVYINGKLVLDRWAKVSFTVTTVPYEFVKGKLYDLKVEYHETTGNARFRLVWDYGIKDQGPSIDEAVRLARRSQAAIVVVGIEEGESFDRASLSLPGRQEEMIRKIAATGTPVTVVIVGGSAVTMTPWLDRVRAVVDAWYPGEAGGQAVAEVLFGDYSPAGRLPVTFPQSVAQLPLNYDHKPTGRGDDYIDMTGKPLFPFGFGLSYSTFEYSGLSVAPAVIPPDGKATVSCRVTNTGALTADEVVQLYIHHEYASVVTPVQSLKGFRRITLLPGESQTVSFELGKEELSLLDAQLRRVVECHPVSVMVGSSSRDIRLRGLIDVQSSR